MDSVLSCSKTQHIKILQAPKFEFNYTAPPTYSVLNNRALSNGDTQKCLCNSQKHHKITMQNSSKVSPKFSPVSISPGSKVSQGKNLTGYARLVRDIAAELHSSIQQWNALHLNGVSFLKNIARLKVDKTFPEELAGPCEDLGKVCDEADKIVENLRILTSQIKSISHLHKTEDNLFSTWPVEKFVSTIESIYEVYKKEAEVKRIILENVAHDHRDSWKMLHLAAWVHQTQISDSVTTNLESMLIETKLR